MEGSNDRPIDLLLSVDEETGCEPSFRDFFAGQRALTDSPEVTGDLGLEPYPVLSLSLVASTFEPVSPAGSKLNSHATDQEALSSDTSQASKPEISTLIKQCIPFSVGSSPRCQNPELNYQPLSTLRSGKYTPQIVLKPLPGANSILKSQQYYNKKRSLADDGFRWRKYGEKVVKGADCSRSYYRCTHSNCFVKRIVEKNLDGVVIEILFKGNHNHDPTQKTRSSKGERFPPGVPESVELTCSDDHTKNDPNRRIREVPQITVQPAITNPGHKDGYKWRKYGQKMVKGNPNPRSYYRCTHKGCQVRKHAEKSLDDANILIIKYEGSHDHEKPDQMNENVTSCTNPFASAAFGGDVCNASNKSVDVELRSSSSAKESEITEGNTSEMLESTEEKASEVLESAEKLVNIGTCSKNHELELYSDATNLEALSSDASQATRPELVLRSVSETNPNLHSWRYYCEKRSLVDDGYKWCEYGKKRVKSTDCLISYYRCTHSNRLVKRNVEKKFAGAVSEVHYKGQHNREPTEKFKRGVALVLPPCGSENAKLTQNTVSSHDMSNDPKDRIKEVSEITVQTASDLAYGDGYKWRKYGQKIVKGNPNPRSYYRCTHKGCRVRKRVGKSLNDANSLVITYEGEHVHENSGKMNENVSSASTHLATAAKVRNSASNYSVDREA